MCGHAPLCNLRGNKEEEDYSQLLGKLRRSFFTQIILHARVGFISANNFISLSRCLPKKKQSRLLDEITLHLLSLGAAAHARTLIVRTVVALCVEKGRQSSRHMNVDVPVLMSLHRVRTYQRHDEDVDNRKEKKNFSAFQISDDD